jgi:hypothetical protein
MCVTVDVVGQCGSEPEAGRGWTEDGRQTRSSMSSQPSLAKQQHPLLYCSNDTGKKEKALPRHHLRARGFPNRMKGSRQRRRTKATPRHDVIQGPFTKPFDKDNTAHRKGSAVVPYYAVGLTCMGACTADTAYCGLGRCGRMSPLGGIAAAYMRVGCECNAPQAGRAESVLDPGMRRGIGSCCDSDR